MATERVLLPTNVIPFHYDIEITPDLKSFKFDVDETVHVNVNEENVNTIAFHARELYIHEAFFNGPENPMTSIKYNFKEDGFTTTLTFSSSFPIGKGELKLKFTGILNSDMAGFYRSQYTDADGNKKFVGSTQFEALDARRAFCCWDEPARKATFSISMVVPSNLNALSNMPEIEVQNLPNGMKRVAFDKSPIMSTYLVAWVVGEFDVISGVTNHGVVVRVFAPPGRAKQGRFALDVGLKALDFYDDFFQVPYPLPKLDMVCITEFAAGAMENWGLVTYRENALMIEESKASSITKQRVASVVAHELAHQWFGNLVTMEFWDGLWLNEGFASFMQEFCIDAIFPGYKMWDQWTTESFANAMRLDSLRSSHPIIVPIKRAEEVEQIFDAISYAKGSTVVQMIYTTLGYDDFRKGLQIYFQRHKYGNTETKDLWNAWTEASGIDVSELMKTWTTRLGYPYVSVVSENWTSSSVEITLKQSWFLADGSITEDESNDTTAIWQIPLLFATNGQVSGKAVIMNKKSQTFTIPLMPGSNLDSEFLKINAGQKALVRVAYSPSLLSRLSNAASKGFLTDVDTASILLDCYALAKANILPIDNVITILKGIDSDIVYPSYILWNAVSGILNAMVLLLDEIGGTTLSTFKAFAKDKIIGALKYVTWDQKENDGHTEKLLRSTLISLLDTFAYDDSNVIDESRKRFDEHFTNPAALSSEYKTTVYKIILLNSISDKEYNQILSTFYNTSDNQEKKYALLSLGVINDPNLKIKTLDWATKSGDVKLQDFFYAYGVTAASSKAGLMLTWKYYKDNFTLLEKMLSKAVPWLQDALIVQTCGRFVSHELANEMEEFFRKNPLPSSSRRIAQTLELVRSNAKLLDLIKVSSIQSNPDLWRNEK